MRKISYLLILISLVFITANRSFAQGGEITLNSLLGANQILVIGESYGQIESANFISKIVADYVSDGACLNVGLEIPTDQQEVLNKAMRGQASMSDVKIDSVVDHDAYREMLVNFSQLVISGKCLSVYAIDSPESMPLTKDAWMEQQVVKIADEKPLVLLVGNKQAVKDFNTPDDSSNKLLAQRLRARSYNVVSVMQYWKGGFCATKNVKLLDTETDKKSAIYVKQAIGEISAEMPEKVSMVSDGVLVWSCEKRKVVEIDSANSNATDRDLIVSISKYDVVERDQEVLNKIKSGIKHQYPVVGMSKEEATRALGEPDQVEKAGNFEQWVYQCFDEDGFYYDCYTLRFREDYLVNLDDLK